MGFLTNLMKNLTVSRTKDLSAALSIGKQVENNVQKGAAGLSRVANEFATGIKNWWYSQTGRSYLTDDYQHEEQLANTAYQRAAADMSSAGLSKYGGVGIASSPSPQSGNGLLATALAAQQLKSAVLDYDVAKYNFGKSKEWGVTTDATGEFAKYDAICKVLFGKSLSEVINNDGGLFGALGDFFNGDVDSDNPFQSFSNFLTGASIDKTQSVVDSMPADGLNLPPVDYHESSNFGFKKGEYPSLFSHPDFYTGVYEQDGKLFVKKDQWSQLQELADIAGISFDKMKSLLYDWYMNAGGSVLIRRWNRSHPKE